MKYALTIFPTDEAIRPDELARAAEDRGFESLFFPEHTHILAFEGDSQVMWFEGGWGEYVDWVTANRGADALEPHRIKYKPLVRPGA